MDLDIDTLYILKFLLLLNMQLLLIWIKQR